MEDVIEELAQDIAYWVSTTMAGSSSKEEFILLSKYLIKLGYRKNEVLADIN